jgi:hypothetical protein
MLNQIGQLLTRLRYSRQNSSRLFAREMPANKHLKAIPRSLRMRNPFILASNLEDRIEFPDCRMRVEVVGERKCLVGFARHFRSAIKPVRKTQTGGREKFT